MDEDKSEETTENIMPLRDLFHFNHFTHFYRMYVPGALIVGLVCGLLMVVFQIAIDLMIGAFALSGIPLFLSPLIGGLFSGAMIKIGRREVQGSGISKAIEMTHSPSSFTEGTAATKLFATTISIGSGNPVGREGPAVLMGAAIGNSVGYRMGFSHPAHLRVFLMMGSAAATAGIYKAPLGGALFATEAPYRRDARLGYFVPTVLSALTSFLVFSLVMGFILGVGLAIPPLFPFTAMFIMDLGMVPVLLVFGFLAGVVAIFFATFLMYSRNIFRTHLPDWADPIAGSLAACVFIFIIGLALNPELTIAGMGYSVINIVATTDIPLMMLVALLLGKLFASSFVVAGRVSGGVFASSLFVGAMLGAVFGEFIFPGYKEVFMILGMGAVLAATTNTPVATIVIMLEISRSFDLVIPLAIVVSVAYLLSGGSSLYEGQKLCRDDEESDYYPPINILAKIPKEFVKDEETEEVVDDDEGQVIY
jgi:CIC family chloride channel protein